MALWEFLNKTGWMDFVKTPQKKKKKMKKRKIVEVCSYRENIALKPGKTYCEKRYFIYFCLKLKKRACCVCSCDKVHVFKATASSNRLSTE